MGAANPADRGLLQHRRAAHISDDGRCLFRPDQRCGAVSIAERGQPQPRSNAAGQEIVSFVKYREDGHTFGRQWRRSIERTVAFFDDHLD
jgi:hypothetical protein